MYQWPSLSSSIRSAEHLDEIINTTNYICIPLNDEFLHMNAAKLFIQLHPPINIPKTNDEWAAYINNIILTPYITLNTFFERLMIIHLIYSHFKVPIKWSALRFHAFVLCREAIQIGDTIAQLRSLLKTVIFHCPLNPCCVDDIFCINCFYEINRPTVAEL